jgi:hypothetical protein
MLSLSSYYALFPHGISICHLKFITGRGGTAQRGLYILSPIYNTSPKLLFCAQVVEAPGAADNVGGGVDEEDRILPRSSFVNFLRVCHIMLHASPLPPFSLFSAGIITVQPRVLRPNHY